MANESVFRRMELRKTPDAGLTAQEAEEAARLIQRLLEKAAQGSLLERGLRSIETIVPAPSGVSDRGMTVELGRQTFLARRARSRFIEGAMFGEPAWDMLLALYVSEGGKRQSVSSLAGLSGVPVTTALRWIDYLVGQDLARREPHMTDRRVWFVAITDKGRDSLDAYFSTLIEKVFADQ